MMPIRGFLRTSFLDFPGRVAAVIWTPGCNLRCPICYNRELVFNDPGLPRFSEDEVLDFLAGQRDFVDGLVVTGGEPTLQPGLADFLKRVKKIGGLVKLDTNGTNPESLAALFRDGLVDFVAMDIKAPLRPEKYAPAAGLSPEEAGTLLERVRSSVDLILNSRLEYELRTTIVPGLTGETDLLEIARFLRERAGTLPARYAVQNFFPAETLDTSFRGARPWEKERLERLRLELGPFVKELIIRSR